MWVKDLQNALELEVSRSCCAVRMRGKVPLGNTPLALHVMEEGVGPKLIFDLKAINPGSDLSKSS